MRSRVRGGFDIGRKRRAEIVTIAKNVGAADTEDLWRYLVAWVWHNRQSKDQVYAVINAAWRMGRPGMTEDEALAIVKLASETRRCMEAGRLGGWLGLKHSQRMAWGITTIRDPRVGPKTLAVLRRHRKREAEERRRRARGARPQAQSLSRLEPWKEAGMSRPTYYRKGLHKQTKNPRETTSWTPSLLVHKHEPVSQVSAGRVWEGKGDSRQGRYPVALPTPEYHFSGEAGRYAKLGMLAVPEPISLPGSESAPSEKMAAA